MAPSPCAASILLQFHTSVVSNDSGPYYCCCKGSKTVQPWRMMANVAPGVAICRFPRKPNSSAMPLPVSRVQAAAPDVPSLACVALYTFAMHMVMLASNTPTISQTLSVSHPSMLAICQDDQQAPLLKNPADYSHRDSAVTTHAHIQPYSTPMDDIQYRAFDAPIYSANTRARQAPSSAFCTSRQSGRQHCDADIGRRTSAAASLTRIAAAGRTTHVVI